MEIPDTLAWLLANALDHYTQSADFPEHDCDGPLVDGSWDCEHCLGILESAAQAFRLLEEPGQALELEEQIRGYTDANRRREIEQDFRSRCEHADGSDGCALLELEEPKPCQCSRLADKAMVQILEARKNPGMPLDRRPVSVDTDTGEVS